MASVDVVNLEGKTVGQVELSDAVFAVAVKPHLLHEAVRWQLAGERAGTHSTKRRGEVSGSGRKLWKQKGTGRARVGSIRSPIWRKGGIVHGPKPRDYSYRLPRKVLLGALRSALTAKLEEQKLTVVEDWALESHRTKIFRETLGKLNGQSQSFLIVEKPGNRNLELASRNLHGTKMVAPQELRPYDLLLHDRLLVSKDAALRLSESLEPHKRGEARAEGRSDTRTAAPSQTVQIEPAPKKPVKKAAKPAAKAKPAKAEKAPAKKKKAKAPKAKKD
ncbi:MAG: 50S ribosomal protein L4 [Acidipila sp.]|nr:50S ribosomal protein L4 [Acidipila sp.]